MQYVAYLLDIVHTKDNTKRPDCHLSEKLHITSVQIGAIQEEGLVSEKKCSISS